MRTSQNCQCSWNTHETGYLRPVEGRHFEFRFSAFTWYLKYCFVFAINLLSGCGVITVVVVGEYSASLALQTASGKFLNYRPLSFLL